MQKSWYLLSSHGAVLFYIAVHPGCTIQEITDDMCLTRRTVWGLIGDLRRANMLHVERDGRRHHYTVDLDSEFKHPIMTFSMRAVLGPIVENVALRYQQSVGSRI